LAWTILDIGEVVTWEELQIDLSELEQRIFSSNTGMHLSFTELREFGRRTRQVIDGLFVACVDTARLPQRQDPDATILAQAEMVVAAFDSTWWLISAPEHVLQRVGSCFPEMTEHDASAPLRAWGPTPE
jgi:hypothetical protein